MFHSQLQPHHLEANEIRPFWTFFYITREYLFTDRKSNPSGAWGWIIRVNVTEYIHKIPQKAEMDLDNSIPWFMLSNIFQYSSAPPQRTKLETMRLTKHAIERTLRKGRCHLPDDEGTFCGGCRRSVDFLLQLGLFSVIGEFYSKMALLRVYTCSPKTACYAMLPSGWIQLWSFN